MNHLFNPAPPPPRCPPRVAGAGWRSPLVCCRREKGRGGGGVGDCGNRPGPRRPVQPASGRDTVSIVCSLVFAPRSPDACEPLRGVFGAALVLPPHTPTASPCCHGMVLPSRQLPCAGRLRTATAASQLAGVRGGACESLRSCAENSWDCSEDAEEGGRHRGSPSHTMRGGLSSLPSESPPPTTPCWPRSMVAPVHDVVGGGGRG